MERSKIYSRRSVFLFIVCFLAYSQFSIAENNPIAGDLDNNINGESNAGLVADPMEQLANIIRKRTKELLITNLIEVISYGDSSYINRLNTVIPKITDTNLQQTLLNLKGQLIKSGEAYSLPLKESLVIRVLQTSLAVSKIDRKIYRLTREIEYSKRFLDYDNVEFAQKVNELKEAVNYGFADYIQKEVYEILFSHTATVDIEEFHTQAFGQINQLTNLRNEILDRNPILRIDNFYFYANRVGKRIIRTLKTIAPNFTDTETAQVGSLDADSKLLFDPIEAVIKYFKWDRKKLIPGGLSLDFQIPEGFDSAIIEYVDPYSDGFGEAIEDAEEAAAFDTLRASDSGRFLRFINTLANGREKFSFDEVFSKTLNRHLSEKLDVIFNSITEQLIKISRQSDKDILELLRYENIRNEVDTIVKGSPLARLYKEEVKRANRNALIKYYVASGVALGASIVSAFFPETVPVIYVAALDLGVFGLGTYTYLKTKDIYADAIQKRFTSVIGPALVSEAEFQRAKNNYLLSVSNMAVDGIVATSYLKTALGRGRQAIADARKFNQLGRTTLGNASLQIPAPLRKFVKNYIDSYSQTIKLQFGGEVKWGKKVLFTTPKFSMKYKGKIIELPATHTWASLTALYIVINEVLVRGIISGEDNQFFKRDRNTGNIKIQTQGLYNLLFEIICSEIFGGLTFMKTHHVNYADPFVKRLRVGVKDMLMRLGVAQLLLPLTSATTQLSLNMIKWGKLDIDEKRIIFDWIFNFFGHPTLYEPHRKLKYDNRDNLLVFTVVRYLKVLGQTFVRTPFLDYYMGDNQKKGDHPYIEATFGRIDFFEEMVKANSDNNKKGILKYLNSDVMAEEIISGIFDEADDLKTLINKDLDEIARIGNIDPQMISFIKEQIR